MSDSYITSGAILKCSFGDKTSRLVVLPDRTVCLTGPPTGNVSDHVPMCNIMPFGRCRTLGYPPTAAATAAAHGRLTPMPCIPGTIFEWLNGKNDYLVKGKAALLKSSYCRCQYGGVITFVNDGQLENSVIDNSREAKESEEEIKKQSDEKYQLTSDDVDNLLDGIQLALDMAGMAPGVGAIPDLLNASISACRGDLSGAAMSVLAAVPGIGDAAGAAKIVSRGAKIAKKGKMVKAVSKAAEKTVDKVVPPTGVKGIPSQKISDINANDNVVKFDPTRRKGTSHNAAQGLNFKVHSKDKVKEYNVQTIEIKEVNGTTRRVNKLNIVASTEKIPCVNKIQKVPAHGSQDYESTAARIKRKPYWNYAQQNSKKNESSNQSPVSIFSKKDSSSAQSDPD